MADRRKRFWQRVEDYGNDETRDPFTHSSAYHRHFQGYAEWQTPREKGKGYRIQRIYVANFYCYGESDDLWRWKKLGFAGLFVLMAAASLFADTYPAEVNYIPAVGALQMLSIIPLVWLMYKLILQLTAPRKMTIGERGSTADGFRKAALVCAWVLLGIAAVMPIGQWLMYRSLETADWMAAGWKLVSAGLAFGLYFAERRRTIESLPNPAVAPTGANEIW